jgi:hypothetical protein
MKPHGPAIGIAANSLSAHHFRDSDMFIEFSRALRTSAYVVTLGSALAACGGGGGGDSTTTASSTSTTSTAADTTATDTTETAITVPVSSADDTAAAAATTDLSLSPIETSSTSATTTVAESTVTVAAASTVADVTSGTAAATAVSARSGVGMNLGFLTNTSPEIPSIDLMKRAGAWYVGCSLATNVNCKDFTGTARGFDTLEEDKLDVDAQGWIKTLPAAGDTTVKFRYATTILSSGIAPDGKYIVRYDGTGTITYSGMAKKVVAESTAGRDVVQLTNSSTGGFFLTINATTAGNYLRNIRVYAPGGACANDYTTFAASAADCTAAKGAYVPFESFPATQQWYPPFITDAKGFRTLRFMDWMRTNTNLIADWANRPLPTDRTWAGDNGAPVETMIDLANAAGADPWMNMPTHATDDYVLQFARLAHQRLSTKLTLNLEYSNEPWNYSFIQTNWMKAQAATKWATELSKGANPYTLQYNWYAQRLAQVCSIVKTEFGADASRVRCIANSQAANSAVTTQMLACTYAASALGKPCGKLIDVLAIAPYFGHYLGLATYRPTVTGWYADADGGLSKVFQEITATDSTGKAITAPLVAAGSKFPTGSLGMSKGWMVATKAVADTYGLPMWAYEGGQHLVPPAGDADTTFLALITSANRDSRMGSAYEQNFADWKAAGGQTFVYYSHVALPGKYGIWGMKERLTDVNNPKWKAVTKVRDASACWWTGC